jgi:queuosine precursor transporter
VEVVVSEEGIARPEAAGPGSERATRRRQLVGVLLGASYVLTIVLANYAITHWGTPPVAPGAPYTVPVWPGVAAPSGVLFAGLAFTFRDLTQEWLGRKAVILTILIGALLSWRVTSNRDLAVASAGAFLFSEFADFAVYQPFRERRWLLAVALSNVVGLIIDSLLFLQLAFGSLEFWQGQMIGKAWTTVFAIVVLLALRQWIIPRRSRPADEPTVPELA